MVQALDSDSDEPPAQRLNFTRGRNTTRAGNQSFENEAMSFPFLKGNVTGPVHEEDDPIDQDTVEIAMLRKMANSAEESNRRRQNTSAEHGEVPRRYQSPSPRRATRDDPYQALSKKVNASEWARQRRKTTYDIPAGNDKAPWDLKYVKMFCGNLAGTAESIITTILDMAKVHHMSDNTISLALTSYLDIEARQVWLKLLECFPFRTALHKLTALYLRKKSFAELVTEKRALNWDRAKQSIHEVMAKWDLLTIQTNMGPDFPEPRTLDMAKKEALFRFVGPKMAAKLENKQMKKMEKGIIWKTDDLTNYANELIQMEKLDNTSDHVQVNTIDIQPETIHLNNLAPARTSRRDDYMWDKMRRNSQERREKSKEEALRKKRESSAEKEYFEPLSQEQIAKRLKEGDIEMVQTVIPTEAGISIRDHATGKAVFEENQAAKAINIKTDRPVFVMVPRKTSDWYNNNRRQWKSKERYNWRDSRNNSLNRGQSPARSEKGSNPHNLAKYGPQTN